MYFLSRAACFFVSSHFKCYAMNIQVSTCFEYAQIMNTILIVIACVGSLTHSLAMVFRE